MRVVESFAWTRVVCQYLCQPVDIINVDRGRIFAHVKTEDAASADENDDESEPSPSEPIINDSLFAIELRSQTNRQCIASSSWRLWREL